ncbi:MAG: hypothetical protein V3T83_00445 [Acidobacteriota bacterium]
MHRNLVLPLGMCFLLLAAALALAAQDELKKDTGYLVAALKSELLLSKKPVSQLQIQSLPEEGGRGTFISEKSGKGGEKGSEEGQPQEKEGEKAMIAPSGGGLGGGTFVMNTDSGTATIYSILLDANTEKPEKLERGAKLRITYRLQGGKKVALRVEVVKPSTN